MAGPMTTMFGKAYDTVGSADRNLILQTRGDLKVKWGNKYIDLIKNGKINVDVDLLKKIDSKDSIHKDGLYLIEKENTSEVWLSIGGSIVNLLGEVMYLDVFIAFLKSSSESRLQFESTKSSNVCPIPIPRSLYPETSDIFMLLFTRESTFLSPPSLPRDPPPKILPTFLKNPPPPFDVDAVESKIS